MWLGVSSCLPAPKARKPAATAFDSGFLLERPAHGVHCLRAQRRVDDESGLRRSDIQRGLAELFAAAPIPIGIGSVAPGVTVAFMPFGPGPELALWTIPRKEQCQ